MAERKSGPVKPPVIDLKAREATETPEEQDTAPTTDATPRRKSASARRGARSRQSAAPTESPKPADSAAPKDVEPSADSAASATSGAPDSTSAPPAADSKPATDSEAETRSTASDPVTPADPGPAEAPIPPPPRPPARLAMPWSAISVAAVVGAILGAGLTYLAANWIALPQQEPPFADPAPALEELAATAENLAARLAAVEETARTTRVSLDATLAQFDATSTELRQQLADVAASIPEPQNIDLTAIENDLAALDGRVAAIAAGASSEDAAALAQNLAGMERTLAALSDRLDGFEASVATGDSRIADLANQLEEARAAIAAQTRTLGGADIGPAVKLPLIVSGLEAAFATGRPYGAVLDGLIALLPDLEVPRIIAAEAATGLARPDAIVARFEAALPDIIAGRTRDSSGDLAQDALEWAKALLALRPAEEIEGDTPEAVISRLEAAMERRDFVAAATELAQLPPAMQEAAGDVGADIAAHAQAETFIIRLRTEALAPATEPAS